MNQRHLQSYLYDHLAGATAGLELIDFLISVEDDPLLSRSLAELREQINADLETLRELVNALGFALGTWR